MKRLLRNTDNELIGGVCSGLADYFNMDITIVRLIFVFGSLFTCIAFGLVYLVLWIVVPEE